MGEALIDIDVPGEYVALCVDWHSGVGDMMYAVATTGGLTLGCIRPRDDDGRPMTDREWHHHLWTCLAWDVMRARLMAEKMPDPGPEDDLVRFEDFVNDTVEMLAREYGLEV